MLAAVRLCQKWRANKIAAAVPTVAAADDNIGSADAAFASNATPTYDAGCASANLPENTRLKSWVDETMSVDSDDPIASVRWKNIVGNEYGADRGIDQ